LSHRALDLDPAASLLHDPIHGGKAQSSALSLLFGGEEWFKGVLKCTLVHPNPGVSDGEQQVLPWMRLRIGRSYRPVQFHIHRSDPESAPVGHGIASVYDEIHDELVDLSTIGHYLSQLRVEPRI